MGKCFRKKNEIRVTTIQSVPKKPSKEKEAKIATDKECHYEHSSRLFWIVAINAGSNFPPGSFLNTGTK